MVIFVEEVCGLEFYVDEMVVVGVDVEFLIVFEFCEIELFFEVGYEGGVVFVFGDS